MIPTIPTSIVVAVFALIGVLLTVLVTWSVAQRRIAAEHVTRERAKWRHKIRVQALKVHDAILCGEAATVGRLQSEFRALLNPFDPHDQAILKCIAVVESYEERKMKADEFSRRISLLLKHDWERAKLEAGLLSWNWMWKPERVQLERTCGKNGEHCAWKELPRCQKYEVRKLRALAFAAAALTVGIFACLLTAGILACLWNDKSSLPTNESSRTRVLAEVGENDRACDADG